MKKSKKPVILITGYLGSGKTTLLNNILKQEKRKVALIVNDMGSINVDAEILKKNGSNVAECPMFELQNGCICCTLRDEFIEQVEKISTLIVDQIEFCNFIVLNKCDLLSADQLKEVEAIVRDFQPRAPIIHSVNGDIDIDKIMTTNPFNYSQIESSSAIQKATASLLQTGRRRDSCVDEYGISSFVFETRQPFNRTRFMDFVNNRYPSELIRSKGYIWFSDASRDVQLFEQAGRNSSVMPVSFWIDALREDQKQAYLAENPEVRENWDSRYGDRENQVVFIGKGYNKDSIRMELEKCLD